MRHDSSMTAWYTHEVALGGPALGISRQAAPLQDLSADTPARPSSGLTFMKLGRLCRASKFRPVGQRPQRRGAAAYLVGRQ